MAKAIKIYRPKFLIKGAVIQMEGMYVAIPDKGYKNFRITVLFDNRKMEIKNWHKADTFRRFHDKLGGKDYTLAYFKWVPYYDPEDMTAIREPDLVRVEKNGHVFWEKPKEPPRQESLL